MNERFQSRVLEAVEALQRLRHEALCLENDSAYFTAAVDAAAHNLCPIVATMQGRPAGSAMVCEHSSAHEKGGSR